MPRPITPNLKDDEFELTVLCPIGACFAQHTYAFSKEVLKQASYRRETKQNIFGYIEKAHKDGMHKKPAEVR